MEIMEAQTVMEPSFQRETINDDDAVRLVTSQLTNRVHAAMLHSHVVVKDIDANITRLINEFTLQHESLLESFTESLQLSREYEQEYNERLTLLNECERAASSYFAEHGEHVENMERMQAESLKIYSQRVDDMTTSLQSVAEDLVRTSIANKHNINITTRQRERPLSKNELLQQLLEMERRLKKIRKSHQFGESDTKQLEEAITLHSHRLDVARTQNTQLRCQIKELSDKLYKARELNDTKTLLSSQANEFDNKISTLSDTINNESNMDDHLINRMADTRRKLDEATEEVKELNMLHQSMQLEYTNLLSSENRFVKKYNECDKLAVLPQSVRNTRHKLQASMPNSLANAFSEIEETKAEQAVRRIVRNALIELNTSMREIFATRRQTKDINESSNSNYQEANASALTNEYKKNKFCNDCRECDEVQSNNQDIDDKMVPLEHLLEMNDMEKLKAVQNYVVSAVNRQIHIHALAEEREC